MELRKPLWVVRQRQIDQPFVCCPGGFEIAHNVSLEVLQANCLEKFGAQHLNEQAFAVRFGFRLCCRDSRRNEQRAFRRLERVFVKPSWGKSLLLVRLDLRDRRKHVQRSPCRGLRGPKSLSQWFRRVMPLRRVVHWECSPGSYSGAL